MSGISLTANEEWPYSRARFLFKQQRERASTSDTQLTASQSHGVISQSLYNQISGSRATAALSGTGSFVHVEKDDFVISLRTFEGGVERAHKTGCISPAYTVMRPAVSVNPDFFHYLLKSCAFIQVLQTAVTGIRDGKSVRYEHFAELTLPCPDINTQKAIAAFLDRETARIDRLTEKKERQEQRLQERQATIINDAVKGTRPTRPLEAETARGFPKEVSAWPSVKPLRRLASIRSSNVDKVIEEGEEHVRLCNYVDVYYNDRITDLIEFSEGSAKQSEIEKFGLKPGDVVITKDSETPDDIAVPALVESSAEGAVCGYHLAILRPRPNVMDSTYLF